MGITSPKRTDPQKQQLAPLVLQQQPVHVGCVTGSQPRERQSSAHPSSSCRFNGPVSDENASYRLRALLYQDDDCIVPEEDYNHAEWSYEPEQC